MLLKTHVTETEKLLHLRFVYSKLRSCSCLPIPKTWLQFWEPWTAALRLLNCASI